MKRTALLIAGAGIFTGVIISLMVPRFARCLDRREAAAPAVADRIVRSPASLSAPASTDPRVATSSRLVHDLESAAPSRLPALVTEWARRDPMAVTAWLGSLPPGRARDLALKSLVIEFAGAAPDLVAGFVGHLPDTTAARETAATFVTMWAKRDIESAVAWARNLDNGPMKEILLANVAAPWAEANPQAAADFAATLPSAPREAWRETIAERWMREDATGAIRWAEQQPAALRTEFLSSFVSSWAQIEPARAATLITDLPVGAARTDTTLAVIAQWSRIDPSAAAAWIARQPEEVQPSSAIENLVTTWMSRDPAGADRWALTLPLGRMQAAARAALAEFGAGPGVAVASRR